MSGFYLKVEAYEVRAVENQRENVEPIPEFFEVRFLQFEDLLELYHQKVQPKCKQYADNNIVSCFPWFLVTLAKHGVWCDFSIPDLDDVNLVLVGVHHLEDKDDEVAKEREENLVPDVEEEPAPQEKDDDPDRVDCKYRLICIVRKMLYEANSVISNENPIEFHSTSLDTNEFLITNIVTPVHILPLSV